jgi:hypothetical protein
VTAQRTQIDSLVGGAPMRRPNVRTLATQTTLSKCGLASLGFALGVNLDRVIEDTTLAMPFGQSQFAFARGQQFEKYLLKDSCGHLFKALQDDLGFDPSATTVIDLRAGFAPNLSGMIARSDATKGVLSGIVNSRPCAPNLIVGAVFKVTIAGVDAYLEADAVAARDLDGTTIYTGEIKSFPIVDGRIDKEKLGKAADQVAVYQLLMRRVVEEIGGNPLTVSAEAMIITPTNTGFRPHVSQLSVEARIRRSQEMLAASTPLTDLLLGLPSGVGFGAVADKTAGEAVRLKALDSIAGAVGTRWCSSCLPNCGLARYCRRRTHEADDTALAGETVVRLAPGVRTFRQAIDLAEGARSAPDTATAAAGLRAAYNLYGAFAPRKGS